MRFIANIEPQDTEMRVPRYLFKATSNLTPGYISPSAIIPKGSVKRLSERELEYLSGNHWHEEYAKQCTIWSSSFLEVLVLAIDMAERLYEPNVRICVLDTQIMKKSDSYPAVYPRSALHVFSDYMEWESRQKPATMYLASAEIRNENEPCFKMVSYETLVEHGLFHFLPELETDEENWTARNKLSELRRAFSREPRQITLPDIIQSKKIASCFGDTLILPVMVALLSIRERNRKGWGAFRELVEWTDLVIPEGRLVSEMFMFSGGVSDLDAQSLPDVWQFTKVLGDLYGYTYPSEDDDNYLERQFGIQAEASDDDDDDKSTVEGVESLSCEFIISPQSWSMCAYIYISFPQHEKKIEC